VRAREDIVIVALSGGVDSAVAALRLCEAGHAVECLHMSNWEDDAYCAAAADFQDARQIARQLGVPLHRVNFAAQYRTRVFEYFLAELRHGRTPNPDVLCNREIKFGILQGYARRLGGRYLATGHYCRIGEAETPILLRGQDAGKDQSYFLSAVASEDLRDVLFPLGELTKTEVRRIAAKARLPVADKRDSTGICFIGERPFADFLRGYLGAEPGPIRALTGRVLGTHTGLAYYTIGQRQGLGIGGIREGGVAPWYVAGKDREHNELIVVQGHDHPALLQDEVRLSALHWIGAPPDTWQRAGQARCTAKTRYRQADQPCLVLRTDAATCRIVFDTPQRAITPGQYVVLYDHERCLGGGVIEQSLVPSPGLQATG
jgi:tRNA-specific 2-thiouridylase